MSGGSMLALASPSPDVTLSAAPSADATSTTSGSPSPAPSASPVTRRVTLRVGWLGGPDSVDPLAAYSSQEKLVLHLTHDLLTGYRAEDLGPAPELAQSWSHSEDGLTWTFNIRTGATWQDGEPVTAADVAFSLKYVMENQIAPYAAAMAAVESVETTDDTTVIVTCSEPKADMTGLWIPILPEHLSGEIEADRAAGPAPASPAPPASPETSASPGASTSASAPPLPAIWIGSGPFRMAAFAPGKLVRLVANEGYWRGAPAVDEVDLISYKDADVMAADLASGKLDACVGVPSGRVRGLRRDQRLQVLAAPGRGFVDVGFTCAPTAKTANPAQRDPLFRQALNWAVDRRGIVASVFHGLATPGSTVVAPGVSRDPDYHYQPPGDQLYGYDLKKAAKLLADAGYLKLAGRLVDPQREPVALRLYASEAPPQGGQIAQIVARDLRKLGIGVRYDSMPEASLRAVLGVTVDGLPDPDSDLFVSDWVGDTDPNFILSVLTSGQIGSWNDTGWSDPQYDQLFAQQAAALDPRQRKGLVDQLQQIAYDQSPYIVIAYPQTVEAERTDLWQGWVQAPAGDGSALASADNIDTYLYVRPKVGAEPAPAAVPWWVWPALVLAGLTGASLAVAVPRLSKRLSRPPAPVVVRRRAARSPSPDRGAESLDSP